ncbi:MAG: hypothetical protein Kow0032_16910 [Methyloligellaceae bacterium]
MPFGPRAQGGCGVTRRSLLHGLSAGIGAAAAQALAPGGALAAVTCPNACRSMIGPDDDWIAGLPIIDAHCHVFNARDIPVVQFVTRVFLRHYARHMSAKNLRQLEREIRAFMGRKLKQTPGFEQERSLLEARLAGEPVAAKAHPPQLPKFARGSARSCFGKDVADRIAALQNLVSIMTGFRFRIFETLAATYALNLPDVGVALFTPALVDMDYWLGSVWDRQSGTALWDDADGAPQTTPAQQVVLMEMIQRLYPGQCHSFVSYCPWRQLDDERRNAALLPALRRPTALDVVKDAILNRGFVGVKLYPPMGYRPIANAELPASAFPPAAAGEPYAHRFGAALDEALLTLYRFCASHDVPIMAHTAPSNAAGVYETPDGRSRSYAERAHPRYWERVLALPGLSGLRLNLAHFGAGVAGEPDAGWRAVIGQLMDRHPHVYADLAHYAEMVLDNFTGSGQHCQEAANVLDPLRRRFLRPPAGKVRAQRLLYGSDWSMLAKEFYYADYLPVVAHMYRRKIHSVGAGARRNARAFLCGNAIRFLGLRKGERTRARLEAWYSRHALDADLLARFDTVDA